MPPESEGAAAYEQPERRDFAAWLEASELPFSAESIEFQWALYCHLTDDVGPQTELTTSFARQLCDNLVPEVWAEIQALAAPQVAAERDRAREERHRADVMVERHRQLLYVARRVVNAMPEGKHVAVDLAAYNDLRDVLRGIGVL